MSQLNVDSIKDRTGADQPDIVGVAKAFVNFNGTGTVTIRNGFNVSSITDNGTGLYTVSFTNALEDVNYSVVCGAMGNTSMNVLGLDGPASGPSDLKTTSQARLRNRDTTGSAQDLAEASVSIFR